MKKNYCRICGLFIENEPWGNDGKCPIYEICPCCGVEFGNEDYTTESIHKYREEWLLNGAKWHEPKCMPVNWDLKEQMQNISDEYL